MKILMTRGCFTKILMMILAFSFSLYAQERSDKKFLFMTWAYQELLNEIGYHPVEKVLDEIWVGNFLQETNKLESFKEKTGWRQQFMLNSLLYSLDPSDRKSGSVNFNSDEDRKIVAANIHTYGSLKGYDTYIIDEPRYAGGSLHEGTYGPYDEPTRTKFIHYLRTFYSEGEIKKRFGLSDIEKELLFSSEMEVRQPYLFYEFKKFHWWALADYLNFIWAELKKVNPDATTWINLSVCPYDAGVRSDGVDYSAYALSPTFGIISVDPYAHIRENNQYWVSFGTNILSVLSEKPFGTWISGYHGYLSTSRDNSLGLLAGFSQGAKFFGFHAYTHGLNYFVREKNNPKKMSVRDKELAEHYRERYDTIAETVSFIKEQNWLYPYRSDHRVCIYFPTNTYLSNYFDTSWSKSVGAWGSSYFCERIYYSLLRRHIPVDMLMPPLFSSVSDRTPSQIVREKIKQYQVIILPDAESLSDDEVAMLKEWVKKGGVLVATGVPGRCDEAGITRKEWGLRDLFGCQPRKEELHRYFTLTPHGRQTVFTSFGDSRARIFSEILPKRQFLSIPYFKSSYSGEQSVAYYKTGATHPYGKHPRSSFATTFQYNLDKLKNLDIKGVSYRPTTAKVLALWEDNTPAIVMNRYGEGKAILSSATDILTGYEVDGWYNDDFLDMLADLVRYGYDQLRTEGLSPQVEVNLLVDPSKTSYAVTLLNYDGLPTGESVVKLKLPINLERVEWIPFQGDKKSLEGVRDKDWISIKIPGFKDFALLRMEEK